MVQLEDARMRGAYDTPLLFFSRIANVAWPVDRNERSQIFFEGQAKKRVWD
jgi:hypothetical protein